MSVSQTGVLDVQLGNGSCPDGYTDSGFDLEKGCGGDSPTLKSCVKTGTGTSGVQDVSVIQGPESSCPAGYDPMAHPNLSYSSLGKSGFDLNYNCPNNTHLYACVKKGNAPFLADFQTMKDDASPGVGYSKINTNLKLGTGGNTPNLWWWYKPGPTLSDLCNADSNNLKYQQCKDLCLQTPGSCDANVVKYCAANPADTDFCGCYNVSAFNTFKATLDAHHIAWLPECYATQCSSNTAYKNIALANATCSQQICIQDVTLGVEQSKLGNVNTSCNLSQTGTGAAASPSSSSASTSSGTSAQTVGLIVGMVLILLLLCIGGTYLAL